MNIAFCSMLLPEDKNLYERAKGRLAGVALHKLSSALINGLDQNTELPINIFNIVNVPNYPDFPQMMFKAEKWKHKENADDRHIGYINLFAIKYITQAYNLYRELKKWLKASDDNDNFVCVHHIFLPSMFATCLLKCRYKEKVKICLVSGDALSKHGLITNKKKTLKHHLLVLVEAIIEFLLKRFDCFVFATKYMAETYSVDTKPHCIVECAYSIPQTDIPANVGSDDTQPRIIFYAGAIREEYGIVHLLRAFSLIEKDNYRLWIAGGGVDENVVKEYAKNDKRISFLGFVAPDKILKMQQQATVLINPRTSELDFVKYSFSGKNLESLSSGIPYIAHKLPCDPPEYEGHIQYAENESDDALKEKIIEICELSYEERNTIGQKARNFIINEKNPQIMCKRIIDMFDKMS